MDFTKVVNKRHSVRQFTDQAVETDLIKEIVTVAQRTPSWVNSQPWQVYCARGTVLQRIKKAYREADQTGQASQPDLPVMSREEWAPRTQANMKQWRHDIVHHFPSFDEAHTAMSTASNNLYDSPVILFITVPQASPDWSIFDTGGLCPNPHAGRYQPGTGFNSHLQQCPLPQNSPSLSRNSRYRTGARRYFSRLSRRSAAQPLPFATSTVKQRTAF